MSQYPAIQQGAAGLSSYESMGGFGSYESMSGFGAVHSGGTYVDPGCPPTTSTDGPAGVPVYGTTSGPAPTMCTSTDPIAAICNNSRDPGYCFVAKKSNQSWKNRGTAAAVKAWRDWNPTGGPAGSPGVPGAAGAGAGASDDTMLYVGLGVAALAVIGGAVYWKKHKKATMAANRRRSRRRSHR